MKYEVIHTDESGVSLVYFAKDEADAEAVKDRWIRCGWTVGTVRIVKK